MNRTRHARSNPTAHDARWGISSALLIALGSSATLFGALSLGLTIGSGADEATRAVATSDGAQSMPSATGEAGRPAPSQAVPSIAFVPQYSEAVRLRADAPDRADATAPSSPYPAHAGLSR